MNKFASLDPVRKPWMNSEIKGRPAFPGEENAAGGIIGDMPLLEHGNQLVSVWKCKSFLWRLRFLLTGEITIIERYDVSVKAVAIGQAVIAKKEK